MKKVDRKRWKTEYMKYYYANVTKPKRDIERLQQNVIPLFQQPPQIVGGTNSAARPPAEIIGINHHSSLYTGFFLLLLTLMTTALLIKESAQFFATLTNEHPFYSWLTAIVIECFVIALSFASSATGFKRFKQKALLIAICLFGILTASGKVVKEGIDAYSQRVSLTESIKVSELEIAKIETFQKRAAEKDWTKAVTRFSQEIETVRRRIDSYSGELKGYGTLATIFFLVGLQISLRIILLLCNIWAAHYLSEILPKKKFVSWGDES